MCGERRTVIPELRGLSGMTKWFPANAIRTSTSLKGSDDV